APADRIKGFNEQEEFVTVDIEGENIKLEPGENLEAIASGYYDRAKESEDKIERAKEARKETEKQLEELEEEEVEIEQDIEDKSGKRSKKWFEKYRWFYTSEDQLVCIGRDSQTNEMLVKQHMDDGDLYFHADFDGAPSVVLKDGKEAGEESMNQAAKAAVTFSKTWKAGIGADSVYYVDPDQVTKNPESGEYLPKGAFVIRGDREYMRNVKVDAAIGPYKLDGELVPVCGPEEAVREHCDTLIELEPGRTKKSAVAKEINRSLADAGKEVDLDYIIRALPPGKSEVV
ncbi:MAG: NFACT RNA binding domain-containing protein, partial [Candidatus Nanohaloarchaea archaeon]